MTGRTRIAKLKRVRFLEKDGGATAYFKVEGPGRPDFLGPGDVPPFDGEEAWFELERVRGRVWMTWRVLRQVEEPSRGVA